MVTSIVVVVGLSVGAVAGLYFLGKCAEDRDDVS